MGRKIKLLIILAVMILAFIGLSTISYGEYVNMTEDTRLKFTEKRNLEYWSGHSDYDGRRTVFNHSNVYCIEANQGPSATGTFTYIAGDSRFLNNYTYDANANNNTKLNVGLAIIGNIQYDYERQRNVDDFYRRIY